MTAAHRLTGNATAEEFMSCCNVNFYNLLTKYCTLKKMCLELGATYTQGPLDFVHPCPMVVTPLIVSVMIAMYEDATMTVKGNGREGKDFRVRVGVCQSSVHSPLQILIVLEALSTEFRVGWSMQMIFFWLQKLRIRGVADGKVAEMEERHGIEGS